MDSSDKNAGRQGDRPDERRQGRRRFLKQAGAAPAFLLAAGSEPQKEAKLPQIQLGPHRISRLICGANCFNAGSHLSVVVIYEMKK